MNTPTLRELIERATPGPWQTRFIYRLFSSARRDIRMRFNAPESTDWPNSELIARCNPQTMLAVVEALEEYAGMTDVDYAQPALKALRLLNSQPLPTGEK